jgi:hypothetical protein
MAKENPKQNEEATAVEVLPVAEPKAATTAPLAKPLGAMTWEEECAYYKARRPQILGETKDAK